MASTNKTANFKLPQWVGSDHPTWKGDLNDAFSKIDTTLKENESQNTSTKTIVTSLSQQVGTNRSSIVSINDTLSKTSQESANAMQLAKDTLGKVEQTNRTVSTLNETVNKVNQTVTNNSNRIEALEKGSGTTGTIDVNQFKQLCLNYLYPVGTIYFTVSNSNPETLLGGRWQKISSGYYIKTVTSNAGVNSGRSSYDFTLTQHNSPYMPANSEASGYGLSQVEGFKNRVVITRTSTPQRLSIPLTPLSFDLYAWRRVG